MLMHAIEKKKEIKTMTKKIKEKYKEFVQNSVPDMFGTRKENAGNEIAYVPLELYLLYCPIAHAIIL